MIRVFAIHAVVSALLAWALSEYPGEPHKVIGAHLIVVFSVQLLVVWLVFLSAPLEKTWNRLIPATFYAFALVAQLFFWALYAVGHAASGSPFTWWNFIGYVSEYRQLLQVLEISPYWGDSLWLAVVLLWFGLILGLMQSLRPPNSRVWRRGLLWGGTVGGLMVFLGFFTEVRNALSHYEEPTYSAFFWHPWNALDQVNRRVEPDFDVWDSYPRKPRAEAPHVVVMVVDALRADFLPMYNREKGRYTPFLDSLFSGSGWSRVDTAFSAAAASFGGITSLMSGRTMDRLTEHSFTLADALHHQGYRTHFYLSGNHTAFNSLSKFYGRETEFHQYVDASFKSDFTVNDDRIVTKAIERLPMAGDTPVYLHLHFNSVHESGWLMEPYRSTDVGDVNPYMAHYRRGLMQLDDNMRWVWGNLQSKGYLKHAVVAITADHGQMLGEHGEYGHGKGLNAEQVWIPMLFWSTGAPIQVQCSYASSIDFAPTLLHHLELPVPAKWQGIPLQQTEALPRYTFHQARRYYAVVMRSAEGWYQYNRIETENPIREELYDLRSDFRQEHPLDWQDSTVSNEKRRKILEDLRRQCIHYYNLTETP